MHKAMKGFMLQGRDLDARHLMSTFFLPQDDKLTEVTGLLSDRDANLTPEPGLCSTAGCLWETGIACVSPIPENPGTPISSFSYHGDPNVSCFGSSWLTELFKMLDKICGFPGKLQKSTRCHPLFPRVMNSWKDHPQSSS